MTNPIVCAFDLSVAADDAADVSASFARAWRDDLVLVHATSVALHDPNTAATIVRRATSDVVAGLAAQGPGFHAEVVVEDEGVAPLLCRVSAERKARLLVLAMSGADKGRPARRSVVTEVLRHAQVPVLVVNDSNRLAEWLRGERPLRAVAAVAFDDALPAVYDALAALRSVGAVDVAVVHVSYPGDEHRRLGAGPPTHLVDTDPAVAALVRSELASCFSALPGAGRVDVRVVAGLGRADAHLASAGVDADADVIVMGGHQRTGLDWLLHGAADAGVLRLSKTNLLVVPVNAQKRTLAAAG